MADDPVKETWKEPEPPPWGDDPLSRFLHDAQFNERVTALNMQAPFNLVQRAHATFLSGAKAVEKGLGAKLLLPALLMVRTHSSFLAGTRLALSGELTESHAVLRVGIEQAWYALHIATDPSPPHRGEIWLRRDEDDTSKKLCANEFAVGNVRRSHEALDSLSANQVKGLYDRTIDYGAHPNERGLFAGMARREEGSETTYLPPILTGDAVPIALSLQTAAGVAVAGLKIFQLVFPKRFELAGVDGSIDALAKDVDRVFKPYAGG